MSKTQKEEILVLNILDKIGGAQNIKDVYHCATRMRLTLYNDDLAKINEIKTINNLKGALWSNGELQLIIGHEVSQITSLLKTKLLKKEVTEFEKNIIPQKSSVSIWKKLLKSVSAIFGPLIPFLIGVGLIMALQTLLIRTGAVHEIKDGGVLGVDYNIFDLVLNVIAQTGFKLMGVIGLWSTVRYLKGKTPIAIGLGLLMVSPIIPADGVHLLTLGTWDITLKPFYSTILVFIMMGVIVAYAQKTMEKYFHPVANFVLNPFLTLLIGGLIAFFIMGPIMGVVENALISAFGWFMKLPFGLGTLIVGLTWQPLVVLGVHNILFFIAIAAVQNGEPSLFLAAAFAAAWAQMGATIGVMLRSKKMVDKSGAIAAALPGIISGPTESCIYAVNLPKGLPFWTGVIAGGIGGWLIGMFNVTLDNLAGLGGIIGFLAYTDDLLTAIIIDLASFGLGILITYFLYKEDKTEKSLALKTTLNFKKKEFLTGDVDYQAQKLIKILQHQKWLKVKKKTKVELIQKVENLKIDLTKIDQTLTPEINQLLINLENDDRDWKLNHDLIKKLKLIKSERQKELNQIYQNLKKEILELKKINSLTKTHTQLTAKKANWDWKVNRIETLQEEKNAKLFNQGQKLIKSNNAKKVEKGNLLIEKSKITQSQDEKIHVFKNKIQECEKMIQESNISLNQQTTQFYEKIENHIAKIEKIKNIDLNEFKNRYFNDVHHLEIQEKTIVPKTIGN